MAGLTYLSGTRIETERLSEYVHPSPSLGITFVIILILVLVFTSFRFRGSASLGVAALIVILSLMFALFDWWDEIVKSFSYLSIHMNLGFYLFFSTLLAVLWFYVTFIHIRFGYFTVRPGQISRHQLIGEGETNYDTRGAVLEKYREDIFRHWILGLGSGDLKISTTGARSAELIIKDVLFVDRKIEQIRKLIAVQPDDLLDEPKGDQPL